MSNDFWKSLKWQYYNQFSLNHNIITHAIEHTSIKTITVDVHLPHSSVFPSTEPRKNSKYVMLTCFKNICHRLKSTLVVG